MSNPVARIPFVLVLALSLSATVAWAFQAPPAPAALSGVSGSGESSSHDISFREVLLGLPVAAGLGAILALRPVRRGTPPRNAAVIQTQIVLAVVGTLVMQVVGASLARAFGIVGAASLVRYRSKIDDPKDAGVMLSCLAIGLASGVGIYWVAAMSTVFIWGVLLVLESFEPERRQDFLLKIKTPDSVRFKDPIEQLLRKHGLKHEMRTSSPDELTFSVSFPSSKKTDRLTNAILALGNGREVAVEWAEKKPAKDAA
jgi:uncharacterized membrane protein YhiD involved in acid resistance